MIGIGVLIMAAWQSETGRMVLLVIGALLALDLGLIPALRGYRNFLLSQQPRDGELTRASHGMGILVLLVVAGLALRQIWRWQLSDFTNALQAGDPLHWVPALLLLLVVTWGLVWVMTGTRRALRAGAERDSRVMTRSLMKIGAGLVVMFIVYKPPAQYAGLAALLWSVPYLPWAVMAFAAWLAVTGLVKFSLAAIGRRKPRTAPVTPPKPPARDATLDEALEDMRGLGGRKTSLDDREF
jgi:hypothetical protein